MRDLFLTDLNKVNDKEDFKETLRFANSGVEIKLSLISPSCFSASQLKLAYDGIKRKVLPFTTTYQCSPVATVEFGGPISPKQASQIEI